MNFHKAHSGEKLLYRGTMCPDGDRNFICCRGSQCCSLARLSLSHSFAQTSCRYISNGIVSGNSHSQQVVKLAISIYYTYMTANDKGHTHHRRRSLTEQNYNIFLGRKWCKTLFSVQVIEAVWNTSRSYVGQRSRINIAPEYYYTFLLLGKQLVCVCVWECVRLIIVSHCDKPCMIFINTEFIAFNFINIFCFFFCVCVPVLRSASREHGVALWWAIEMNLNIKSIASNKTRVEDSFHQTRNRRNEIRFDSIRACHWVSRQASSRKRVWSIFYFFLLHSFCYYRSHFILRRNYHSLSPSFSPMWCVLCGRLSSVVVVIIMCVFHVQLRAVHSTRSAVSTFSDCIWQMTNEYYYHFRDCGFSFY